MVIRNEATEPIMGLRICPLIVGTHTHDDDKAGLRRLLKEWRKTNTSSLCWFGPLSHKAVYAGM